MDERKPLAKGLRQWSLKQLHEVIEEICVAKIPNDARQAGAYTRSLFSST